jgi:hypothetical protein
MRRPTPPPCWRVEVYEHDLAGGRWRIPSTTVKVPAETADGARRQVLHWAHADAGAPPWRPLLRESWPHTRATPLGRQEAAA